MTSLLGGDVCVIVGTTVLLAGQIESGAIRGLAVTAPTRTPLSERAHEAGLKDHVTPGPDFCSRKARRPTSCKS